MKEDDYVRVELWLEGMEKIRDFCNGMAAWMEEVDKKLEELEAKNNGENDDV